MPHRGFTTLLLLGLLAFLIVGGVVGYISLKNSTQQKSTEAVVSPTQTTPTSINETIYYFDHERELKDNTGKVIYTFTPALLQELQGSQDPLGMVGNAVSVPGKQGEYYLSVTFIHRDGSIACGVVSNKIYILDTAENAATLFYEESQATLPTNDFRSCDKDMQLVGTEGAKLIVLYHTIETGGPCDYPWAYPDWIYYLDTTDPSGTKKFTVPKELYDKAVQNEKDCQQSIMNS